MIGSPEQKLVQYGAGSRCTSVISGRRPRMTLGTAVLLLLSILVGALSGPSASAQDSAQLEILRGGVVSEEVLAGDLIAIFFASWSPRCRDVVRRANEIDRAWGSRARVLLIDFQEGEAEVASFLEGQEVRVEVTLDRDGAFSKRYGITTLPSLLVLEKGSVAFRGRLPADPDSVLKPILD